MESFSEILSDLISAKELSLRALAKASGVSAVQYSKYLRGTYPQLATAVKIADYFSVSLDYLFGITDIMSKRKRFKPLDMSLFLKRYDEALKRSNLTHWKLCQKNGLGESAIRHWRAGDTPSIESLLIISNTLSVSIDYLVGRSNEF